MEKENNLPSPTDVLLEKTKELEKQVEEMKKKFNEFEDFNRKLLNSSDIKTTDDKVESKSILEKIKEVVTK